VTKETIRRRLKPGPALRQLVPATAWDGSLARWCGALLIFLAGFGSRIALEGVAPQALPFVTFYPCVAIIAYVGGVAPAIAVAILSGLAGWFVFITPGGLEITWPGAINIGFFAAFCAALIWLIHRLTSERRVHEAREVQLSAIMDAVPVGIALYELPSGRLLEGSRHLERMLGRAAPDAQIHAPECRAQDEWVCRHADGSRVSASEYPLARMMMEDADTPELEAQLQRGDGVQIWLRITGRAIRDARGKMIGGVIALVDIDAERRAQQGAQRLADEFRTLADNIPTLCWMAQPTGDIYWFNKRWRDYTGAFPETLTGWGGWESAHDPAILPQVKLRWSRSLQTGEPFEMTFPLKGADGIFRPFLTRVVPIRDAGGRVTRWFGVNIEVSAQQRHEQQQQLLINELNHRVKNTLATVQSIAAQTLRGGGDPGEVFENFEARLLNLSEAHNLLTRRNWEGASVGELVERAAAPFRSPGRTAVEVHGPSVWLKSESALGLSMALHELVTNAQRHGALSTPAGRVEIRWTCDPQTGGFHLHWTERDGPAIQPPSRRGFGLRLIDRALAGEIRATSQLDFRPEGLVCTINATLPATALPSAA
jgi:PAS domain S-box-containing protein